MSIRVAQKFQKIGIFAPRSFFDFWGRKNMFGAGRCQKSRFYHVVLAIWSWRPKPWKMHFLVSVYGLITQKLRNISTWLGRRWKAEVKASNFDQIYSNWLNGLKVMDKNVQKWRHFHTNFAIFELISQKLRNISIWLDRHWKARLKPSILDDTFIKIDSVVQKLWVSQ